MQATTAKATAWADGARASHATVDVGLRVAEKDRRHAAAVLAGGVAYRIFFWLLALGLLLGGALGFFDAEDVSSAASEHGLGAVLGDAVGDAARSSQATRWWLLVVGGWLLLWTGYMAAKALLLVHATIWGIPPPRLGNALVASLAFTGGAVGYLAAMEAARWLREELDLLGLAVTLGLFVIPFLFWLGASRALPNRASSWLELVPGAALVAVGVQTLHLLTAYFLGPRITSATALYGSIGIATTILFWLYIVGRLVVAGAILNVSVRDRRERPVRG